MRKLIVSEFVSLDGVMQAPGGAEEDTDGGFAHGGWTWPYWHDDIGGYFMQTKVDCDALLLGRKTWLTHAGAFQPMAEDDPNNPFGGVKRYVVSTTLKSTDAWRNTTLISKDVIEAVRKLKEMPGKNILTDGSSVLIHALTAHGLVDEYSLLVYPVVLGGGKKVFADGVRADLKLVETKSFPSGVVLMRYQLSQV